MNQLPIADLLVSVVVPLGGVEPVPFEQLSKLHQILVDNYANFEILLIEARAGSASETATKALEEFSFTRYFRVNNSADIEVCLAAGLENAIGDVVVTCDLAVDPADQVPVVVSAVLKNNGVAIGINQTRHRYPLLYALGRKFYFSFTRSFLDEPHPAQSTYYVGLSRQALNAILSIKSKYRFLRIFTSQLGLPVTYLNYHQRDGLTFQRKSLLRGMLKGIDSLVVSSTAPLRLAAYLGFCAASLNLLAMLYIVLVNIVKDRVAEGWTTNSMQNTVMFFFVFLILTILCEYLDRLFHETREAPLYTVLEERNSRAHRWGAQYVNVVRE